MRNLFTNQSDQSAFPASDGLTDGASELQTALNSRRYLVSCLIPVGASVQMYKARQNEQPFGFLPFGAALTESAHVPVTFSGRYVYVFVRSGAAGSPAEIYLQAMNGEVEFVTNAQVGVG